MTTKVFCIVTSKDKEVSAVGLRYSFNATTNKWVDEVKLILWGPAEELAVYDVEFQEKVKDLLKVGVQVMACKACADESGITDRLEELGLEVVYVGPVVSQLLKDGWAALTF